MVATCGLSACSAIRKVRDAVHDIRGNKATIDAFSTKLQSGTATPFEATYVTRARSGHHCLCGATADGCGVRPHALGRDR